MPRLIDRTGTRVGRLNIIARAGNKGNKVQWLCKCDCGETTTVIADSLGSAKTKSCGCIHSERARTLRLEHGHAGGNKSPEYRCWAGMLTRCNNTSDHGFPNYGGRGIKVCDSWKHFENFLKDMGTRPSSLHSIDRIDNNGPYAPWNCRWGTTKQQGANKRTTVYVTVHNDVMCLGHACDLLGLSRNTVYARYKRYGWQVKKALGLSDE
jgi:hypothetical protein